MTTPTYDAPGVDMKEYNEKLVSTVKVIGDGWVESPYYDNVESQLRRFWHTGSIFKEFMDRLDLTHTVELACGHGRHSEQIINKAGKITLLDINQTNIDFCKSRFSDAKNIEALLNNGLDFSALADESVTSVFCYDAMVHFDHRCVSSYLQDFTRIAKKGSFGLFHHSNYSYPFSDHYGKNPHSRNFMTKELFARYALDSDLNVEEQVVFDWGGGENLVKNLDCLSLVSKT